MTDPTLPRQEADATRATFQLGTVDSSHGRGDRSDSETLIAEEAEGVPFPMIPGYTVLELLGQGGMGVVFKARDLHLGRYVAIKMVASGPIVTQAMRDRFNAEARAVAMLQHPHIAQVYFADTIENRPYFVMEYIDGGTLSQQIGGEPKSPREAAKLVVKLAEAIDFSHGKGVLHRDLKPANVLLQVESRESRVESDDSESSRTPSSSSPQLSTLNPRIADFGLAKFLDADSSSTRTGDILGTPSYMAPEQAGGVVKNIGPACDIYSLGAILYELLTGRPPFRTPDAMQTVLLVLSEEPVPPRKLQPTVPRDLETICLKCLAKQPAARYATAGALAADLQRFLANEPIQARPVGPWERGVKWARRRPTLALLAAACILGLFAAAAAGIYHNQQMSTALDETTTERDRAKRLFSEAAKQRDRSERLFKQGHQLANSLISDYFRELQILPGGSRARERLAAELIAYLDRIGQDASDDTVLLADLALAYEQIAYVQGNPYGDNRGDKPEALKNYAKALELRKRLVAAKPDEMMPRLELARCRMQIADIVFQSGAIESARKQYGDALQAVKQLREQFPRDNRILGTIIGITGRLGDVDEAEVKLEAALQRYRDALKLAGQFEPSTAEKRKVHDYIRNEQHFRIGQLLEKLQRFDEAETYYLKVYGFSKQRMAQDSSNRISKEGFSQALVALGDINTRRGGLDKAREMYHEALALRRPLAQEAPTIDSFQESVSVVLGRLASTYQMDPRLKPPERSARAIPFLTEALAIREKAAKRNGKDIERLKNLAVAQRQLAEAFSAASQRDRAEVLYRACIESARKLEALQKGSLTAMEFRAEALFGLGIIEFLRGEDWFVKSEHAKAEKLYRTSLDLLSQCLAIWKNYHARNPKELRTRSLEQTAKKMKDYLDAEFKKRLKRAAEQRKKKSPV